MGFWVVRFVDLLHSSLSLCLGGGSGPQAVITPFFIMGGPDIQAMKELGCPLSERCQYREMLWDSSDGGHSRAPFNRGLMRPLYQLLFREGVWHPEYHGRSHIAPKKCVRPQCPFLSLPLKFLACRSLSLPFVLGGLPYSFSPAHGSDSLCEVLLSLHVLCGDLSWVSLVGGCPS